MKANKAIFDKNLLAVFDSTPVAMVLSRPDGSFEYVNPAFLAMLGYEESEVYAENIILSHPDDTNLNKQVRAKLQSNPFKPVTVEKRYVHKSGKSIPGLLTIVAQPDSHNGIARFIAQIVNLEKQKSTERALHLFRSLVQKAKDPIFIIDAGTGNLLDVNESACYSLGYTASELLALNVQTIEAKMQSEFDWGDHIAHLRVDGQALIEGEHIRKDKTTYPVEVSATYVKQDTIEYIVAMARDISERKRSEATIWQQAHFDDLTQLPNRTYLVSKLDTLIDFSQRVDQRFATASLDLDHFKQVNDNYGHNLGDQLLCEVAKRINGCLRTTDIVGRIGGDEFVLVFPATDKILDINIIAQKILNSLSEPFWLDGHKIYVSASMGFALYPCDAKTSENLLKSSDQALYCAKKDGKNRFRFFTLSMQESSERRNWLSQKLRDCVDNDELSLVFQPIVDLSNNSIVMLEALLRWEHKTKGYIPPDEFINVAEENGTIELIGDWVFSQIASLLKQHEKRIPGTVQISINTSPVQFKCNSKRMLNWHKTLAKKGLCGKRIVIEITENVLLDEDLSACETIQSLSDHGINIAVDDFGTGYSSLTYLKRLNVDFLKIDKSFVANISSSEEDLAICEAMIVMAHKLNIRVVAEGIETKEQANLLTKAGCDYGQGYLFSHPHSFETVLRQLHQTDNRST